MTTIRIPYWNRAVPSDPCIHIVAGGSLSGKTRFVKQLIRLYSKTRFRGVVYCSDLCEREKAADRKSEKTYLDMVGSEFLRQDVRMEKVDEIRSGWRIGLRFKKGFLPFLRKIF